MKRVGATQLLIQVCVQRVQLGRKIARDEASLSNPHEYALLQLTRSLGRQRLAMMAQPLLVPERQHALA